MMYGEYKVRGISLERLIDDLLEARGIVDDQAKSVFLNPDYDSHSHNPFLLPDIDKAIDRILRAIESNERIAIYADYDADGIPAAVVLSDLFKKVGYENYRVYIPHRNREGFGLNIKAIDTLIDDEVKLIVTVDCGSTNVSEVAHAKEKGVDVIITDHHELPQILPDALAIVNPKRPKEDGSFYPEMNLCGTAVVYKLVQAFVQKYGSKWNIQPGWEKWLLDMVGIATLSDMVPLLGENRVLASYGLMVLRKTRRPGLLALYRKNRINQMDISADDIVFSITPRINAASRMSEPEDAFILLSTRDYAEAEKMAEELENINSRRKGAVAALVKMVKSVIKERYGENLPEIIFLGNQNWPPALLGLACSSVVDEFGKPVFLWGREGGDNFKGSCRSNGIVNIHDLMTEINSTLFEEFGGHAMAGGFSILEEKIHNAQEVISEMFQKMQERNGNTESVFLEKNVEAAFPLSFIQENLVDNLNKLAPFGTGNEKPKFIFKDSTISSVRKFGQDNRHISISFGESVGIDGVWFGFNRSHKIDDSFIDSLVPGKKIHIVGTLEKGFRGKGVRIKIEDIIQ